MVWRHGRTAWNAEGRFQGQADVPLDDVGTAQAERAARLLAALRPDAVLSSDLARAAHTAAALARVAGVGVGYDKDLRETYLGSWQGRTRAEVTAEFPAEAAAWFRGSGATRADQLRRGGGETETEVAERVAAAVARGLETVPGRGTLVAVTHGGAARVGIGRLLGLAPARWAALGPLANCSWSVLKEGRGGWRLLEHNAGSLPEPVMGDDR